ncbi:MAG: type II secretion system protein [Patescibacteria group bacterium]|nr:type II secretion system protein [Patescibacteria group bacterium]
MERKNREAMLVLPVLFMGRRVNQRADKRGFTLIELLLVIAIIGILAAVLYVGIQGQRERARAHATLESVRSALPYAVDCYMKNDQPIRRAAAGDVCLPSNNFTWPALPNGCVYLGDANISGDTQIASCDGGGVGLNIWCNVEDNARCWIK